MSILLYLNKLFCANIIVVRKKAVDDCMNRIKKLRQKRKMSIDQLSAELKKQGISISPASISKYEREVRNPKIENWNALANYFNVSVSYITGVSDKPDENNSRLKSIRNDKELSFKEVADKYNKEADAFSVFDHKENHITPKIVEDIENNSYKPSQHEWQLLSYALNVPEFYLTGKSNDKAGWQEWSKITGYSVDKLQNEVQRLIDTGRLNKSDDIQHQIGQAVRSLDFSSMDTTQGVLHELNFQLVQLKNAVSNAFLDPDTTQRSELSFEEISKQRPKVRDDMDADAYKAICKILDETRYNLAKIPIKTNDNH